MRLQGCVVQGLGIGAKFGYPTANLDCGSTECPAPGVYAARARFDYATHNAVAVVGARDENGKPLVEVLVLDFKGDLYGKEMEIEVLKNISGIQTFQNEAELVKKIEDDVRKARAYFAR